MQEPYDFGSTLKELRKKKGYTQKRLAAALELSPTAVSKYELNESSPPLDTLRAIAALFNVSLDYLAGMEKRNLISAYNLTDHQLEIINRLIAAFRSQNANTNKKLSPEGYILLGEILEELSK
jgi:transcriptional regulator with XRE-family HTH domain